jgi:putative transposase
VRTYEYRVFPNKAQQQLLVDCLREARHLYNEMVEITRARHDNAGKPHNRYDLNMAFKGRGGQHVPQTTVQMLADRLDKAWKRYEAKKVLTDRAIAEGKEDKFKPRFKNALHWHSIQLRQFAKGKDAWLEGNRLRVPAKIGKSLKVKMHRPLEGTPKTAHLVLRADGHWYVLIVCETIDVPLPVTSEEIGLDVGLKVFLADSDGNTVANPKPYRESEKTLRRKQRTLCCRVKGSRRRRKTAYSIAKTHLKISRQRKDFHHKVSRLYVDKYQAIVSEDLNIQGMVRNHCLAKSISDAGWNSFLNMVAYKAESAGRVFVQVPARFTSQRCFQCGELVPKSLSVRTHVCTHCGYVEDRDVNAAKNILQTYQSTNPARALPSVANVSR